MKNTKRALRRHHRQRMIARALHSYKIESLNQAEKLDWARRNHNHLQMCSCWMCGNRRKWFGPTTQERRQQQREWEPQSVEEGESSTKAA